MVILVGKCQTQANSSPQIQGENLLPNYNNYFIGNDQTKWAFYCRNYSKVTYENIWTGIDLTYFFAPEGMKYEYYVAPEADIKNLQIKVEGADITNNQTSLQINTKLGIIQDANLKVYEQESLEPIQSSFCMNNNIFSFQGIPEQRQETVVIDPLVYSTYLGGSATDQGWDIQVDSKGCVYITGYTISTDLPITPGSYQTRLLVYYWWDSFVTKLDSTGTHLIFSTYIGGALRDHTYGIAVDLAGNSYICGSTESHDFPTSSSAYQKTKVGGNNGLCSAFITKFNPTGTKIVYSTYLGGNSPGGSVGGDFARGIVLDVLGNAYVCGQTESPDFPNPNDSYSSLNRSTIDCFVTKLDYEGSRIYYSAIIGGSGWDIPRGIALDNSGNTYICGLTYSSDFPTSVGAIRTTHNKIYWDAFVTKLTSSGKEISYSTYLGGSGEDIATAIEVDHDGIAYVTGNAGSPGFPVTPGAYGDGKNTGGAFVSKINSTGTDFYYSLCIEGSGETDLHLDKLGNPVIIGITLRSDFPTTIGACQRTYQGQYDSFVTKINDDGTGFLYSTYLAGARADFAKSIDIDTHGKAYISGYTNSIDFPVTLGCFQPNKINNDGAEDAFISILDFKLSPTPPSNLKGEKITPTSIRITWSPSSPGVTPIGKYEIYRSESPSYNSSSPIEIVNDLTNLSYVDTVQDTSRPYFYWIKAVDTSTSTYKSEKSYILRVGDTPILLVHGWHALRSIGQNTFLNEQYYDPRVQMKEIVEKLTSRTYMSDTHFFNDLRTILTENTKGEKWVFFNVKNTNIFISNYNQVDLTKLNEKHPTDKSIAIYAKNLKAEIDKIQVDYPLAKIDIISHSMGGLVSRTLIECTDFKDFIDPYTQPPLIDPAIWPWSLNNAELLPIKYIHTFDSNNGFDTELTNLCDNNNPPVRNLIMLATPNHGVCSLNTFNNLGEFSMALVPWEYSSTQVMFPQNLFLNILNFGQGDWLNHSDGSHSDILNPNVNYIEIAGLFPNDDNLINSQRNGLAWLYNDIMTNHGLDIIEIDKYNDGFVQIDSSRLWPPDGYTNNKFYPFLWSSHSNIIANSKAYQLQRHCQSNYYENLLNPFKEQLGSLELLYDIVNGETITDSSFYQKYWNNTYDIYSDKYRFITNVASPVLLSLQDSQGRITGFDTDGFHEDIPGSFYSILDEEVVCLEPSYYSIQTLGLADEPYHISSTVTMDGIEKTIMQDLPLTTTINQTDTFTPQWDTWDPQDLESPLSTQIEKDVGSDGTIEETFMTPESPANLQGTLGETLISLNWEKPLAGTNPIQGYQLYRANKADDLFLPLPFIMGEDTITFTDSTITPGVTYSYYVQAADTSNNQSPSSNRIIVGPTGTVAFTSSPTGATITIDGITRGVTPLTLTLPACAYVATYSLSGYQPTNKTFDVIAGQNVSVAGDLELPTPTTGTVTFTSTPTGATVILDGTNQGVTPLTLILEPDSYTARFILEGYYEENKLFELVAGETKTVNDNLVEIPKTGTAAFTSTPTGATITIGGVIKGTTPLTITLDPGNYTASYSLTGYQTTTKDFVIVSGEETTVNATLTEIPVTGTATFTSKPSSATITIGGEVKGVTPLTLSLPPGSYSAIYSLPGYQNMTKSFSVTAGSDTPLYASLIKASTSGVAAFTSRPSGASVTVGGVYRGVTPLSIALPPDTYTATLSLTDYPTLTPSFTITTGKTTTVYSNLTGTAAISSRPSGATVTIGGTVRGTTPMNLFLAPGTYDVTFSFAGYPDYTQSCTIVRDQTTSVYGNLSGTAAFTSKPIGATITIGGVVKGVTPLNLILAPGTYSATFSKSGYQDKIETFTVVRNLTVTVLGILIPSTILGKEANVIYLF